MPAEAPLTNREREVLFSIVEMYIQTGEPVASRTISKQRDDSLSPASIRNVMADLAEGGYIEQPHTSAGRIPTGKAYQVYAESLTAGRRQVIDLERLHADLSEGESLAGRIERSSHWLTEVTHNVGIAAAIPASSQMLDQVELLKLTGNQVLMILITRDRMVRNKVLALPEEVSQDDLNAIRNYLNQNFSGWMLADARAELRRRVLQERAAYDAILSRLAVLSTQGLLDVEWVPEFHIEGASNLVGLDLHLTREKMRDLFRALEQKKRILELLDRFLEQPSGEVGVWIGLGDAHPAMKPLALIGLHVVMPSGLRAKIAVLGPMHMDYPRVMSAVWQVGNAFQIAGA